MMSEIEDVIKKADMYGNKQDNLNGDSMLTHYYNQYLDDKKSCMTKCTIQ